MLGKQVVYKETIERPASESILEKAITTSRAGALSLLCAEGRGRSMTSRIAETAPGHVPEEPRGHPGGGPDRPDQGLPSHRYPRRSIVKASFSNPDFACLTLKMASPRRLQEGLPGGYPCVSCRSCPLPLRYRMNSWVRLSQTSTRESARSRVFVAQVTVVQANARM